MSSPSRYIALSVPAEATRVTGSPAQSGNCSPTSRRTSSPSMSSSSACILALEDMGLRFREAAAPERSQRGPAVATAYLRRLRASAHPTLTALHAAPTAAYSELPTP